MAFSLNLAHQIHVLVVEHDPNSQDSITKLLEQFSCKVTLVNLASTASWMLSNRNDKFDFVMASTNSPDLCAFELVKDAAKMDVPMILMYDENHMIMSRSSPEEGIFLHIKKPLTSGTIEYLCQQALKMNGVQEKIHLPIDRVTHIIEDTEENHRLQQKGRELQNNGILNERCNKARDFDCVKLEKKVRVRWTQQLHQKFVEAIKLLGDGRCFPQEIHSLMNVPGLTRMQVASHLQKCRNGAWKIPKEENSNTFLKNNCPNRRKGKFGSMPRLDKCLPHYSIQETHDMTQCQHQMDPSIENGSVHGHDNKEASSYGKRNHPQLRQDFNGYYSNVETLPPRQVEISSSSGDNMLLDNELFQFGTQQDVAAGASTNQWNAIEDPFGFLDFY